MPLPLNATGAYGTDPARRCRILTLPGWQGSGPGHWQSRWEALHGDERVEQAEWLWPRRGDWMARLDEALLLGDGRPAVLVAHSLGCHLVASWAAHSLHTDRVAAALLVSPPDAERADMPPHLFNWRPIERTRLPFPSRLVFSNDDPYCTPERALAMAIDWGSETLDAGPGGHLNGDSGLGDWPVGRAVLDAMIAGSL